MNFIENKFRPHNIAVYEKVHGYVANSGLNIPDKLADFLGFPKLRWQQDGSGFFGHDDKDQKIAAIQIEIDELPNHTTKTQIHLRGNHGKVDLDFNFSGYGNCPRQLLKISLGLMEQIKTDIYIPSPLNTIEATITGGKILVKKFCLSTLVEFLDGEDSFHINIPDSQEYARR